MDILDTDMSETKLLQKVPVVRDEDGYWIHPDLVNFWQVEVEGFSPSHDSKQTPGDLARAAACYAMHAAGVHTAETHPPSIWPRNWSVKWWKPGVSRRDLVKAAALTLAEIERLDRTKGE